LQNRYAYISVKSALIYPLFELITVERNGFKTDVLVSGRNLG